MSFDPFVENRAPHLRLAEGDQDAGLLLFTPWLYIYGQPASDYLQRVTVDGSASATNYVRFTVAGNSADGADVLSWEKVPFSK